MYISVSKHIRLRIDTLLCIAVMPFCGITKSFLILFCAAALHEAGHIAAIYACGAAIDCVTLTPAGVDIRLRGEVEDRFAAVILFCGPMGNMLSAFVAWLFLREYGYSSDGLFFCISSFVFAVFNLLPIGGLDGGSILKIFLSRRKCPSEVLRISRMISFAILLPIWIFAMCMLLGGKENISLISVCIYLFFCAVW